MIENPSLDKPTSGSIRFNTDSSKLEIYDGNAWFEIDSTSPEQQTGGTRGVYSSSAPSTNSNAIEFIQIDTAGNAADFGDLTRGARLLGRASSRTRALFGGDYPSTGNIIDFVTMSSTGDAQDFGDLTESMYNRDGCGSQTRGMFMTGHNPSRVNTVYYVTIAQTGNAVDFGDVSSQKNAIACCSSPTRAFCHGGATPTRINTIDFFTISTLGNSADFGDLTHVIVYTQVALMQQEDFQLVDMMEEEWRIK